MMSKKSPLEPRPQTCGKRKEIIPYITESIENEKQDQQNTLLRVEEEKTKHRQEVKRIAIVASRNLATTSTDAISSVVQGCPGPGRVYRPAIIDDKTC